MRILKFQLFFVILIRLYWLLCWFLFDVSLDFIKLTKLLWRKRNILLNKRVFKTIFLSNTSLDGFQYIFFNIYIQYIYIYIFNIYIYIYIQYIYIYIQYIYKIGVHFLQGGKFFKIHLQIINGESKSCNMTNKSSLCCAQVNNTKTFKSYQTKRAFEIFQ